MNRGIHSTDQCGTVIVDQTTDTVADNQYCEFLLQNTRIL